jgi:hypothetical protein
MESITQETRNEVPTVSMTIFIATPRDKTSSSNVTNLKNIKMDTRLVRFINVEDSQEYISEPLDIKIDISADLASKRELKIRTFSTTSILGTGAKLTNTILIISKLLPPCTKSEVEVENIRYTGLNYCKHAAEMDLELSSHPTLFFKTFNLSLSNECIPQDSFPSRRCAGRLLTICMLPDDFEKG